MPRRPRPPGSSRSEHWLRVAVNACQAALNQRVQLALHLAPSDAITWLSPVGDDDFAEYYDEAFLERLGLRELAVPLADFWPRGGPRWDGLARTSTGKVIVVEAKAYIEEAVDYKSNASAESLARIDSALASAKSAYRASAGATWGRPFYQYANRLAHLYYLRRLNNREAYLLFLYFADAPDVPNPSTPEEWEGAIRLTKKCMGLGAHPFTPFVGQVVWSVGDMLSTIP
jgi:hypothetical protein